MATNTPTPTAENIVVLFQDAVQAGIVADNWYAEARGIAADMAERHGVSVKQAAGVIASVSPLNSWGANVKLAERIIAAGGTMTTGYMKTGLTKASRILAGEPVLDVLTSDKVKNFYLCIESAGQEGVCIDRHAYDIAVNVRHTDSTRPGLTGKRYAAVAACYVEAAALLTEEGYDVTAAQVQSVTWVQWRSRYWNRGAFDLKA